jgi:hypothetical protein
MSAFVRVWPQKESEAQHTCPHCLEWNIRLGVIGNNIRYFIYTFISKSALMEPKTPIGHHGRLLRNFTILASNIERSWARHEVKINDSANYVVLEILAVIVIDFDVHAVTIKQKYTMRQARAGSMLVVHRMSSVKIRLLRYTTSITCPHSAHIV